jgi:hypothetical protein
MDSGVACGRTRAEKIFVHQVLKFATNLSEFRAVVARNLKKTQKWSEMLSELQGGTA